MMVGRGRGGGAPPARVTKNAGLNRFVWTVQHQSGLGAPPGMYQARLKVDATTLTQPLNVLIDPRLAAEGLTAADIKEQFEHNMRMRTLTADVNQTLGRLRDARTKFQNATGAEAEKAKRVEALYQQMVIIPEGVRYAKPGLQEHVRYLAGMTTGSDQKIGRDALERYAVLRKELDAMRAELDKILQ
jgi:hypothetical protein